MRGQCVVCWQMHSDLRMQVVGGGVRVDTCWYPTADYDGCSEKVAEHLRELGEIKGA